MRFLLVAVVCWLVPVSGVIAIEVNVLTFNLRYNEPKDGKNAWPNRKEMAAKVLTDQAVDIAGMQEALVGMIADLQGLLPDYRWIGVGREDGKNAGEFAPIFYRNDRFAVERSGTFWLSETPEVVGSKSWDAALPRIATWGVFRDLRDGRKLFVMNTHFDHKGEEARRQSAKLLIGKIAELSEGLPVALTGDFNTVPESPAVRTLMEDARSKLTDSRQIAQIVHTGGEASFHGFGKTEKGEIIDYIFVGPGFEVKTHVFLRIMNGEVYVSDHWPVVSRLVMP